MITIYDIHTHRNTYDVSRAIVSVSPQQFTPIDGQYYSVGIHPWDSNHSTPQDITLLQQIIQHRQVVAIGETGIDKLRGATVERQVELFTQHITLAHTYNLPLIIHAVRSYDIILAMHRKYNPTTQWIIHGYRGNEITAKQLLDKGIHLSYGALYNTQALINTPIEQLWIESDESNKNIEEIYQKIAGDKNITVEKLKLSVAQRAENLFFK